MGHEPTSQHAMAQAQHQQAQWDREDQWAQLQGAVSPTRGRAQLLTPQGQQTGACTVTQVASCYPTTYPTSMPATGKAAAQHWAAQAMLWVGEGVRGGLVRE